MSELLEWLRHEWSILRLRLLLKRLPVEQIEPLLLSLGYTRLDLKDGAQFTRGKAKITITRPAHQD